jgi:hypothetical protein
MVIQPMRLISIIICAVVSITLAYTGYQYGTKAGADNGYRDGYANRSDEYKQIGYEVGNENGYLIGHKEGYAVGYTGGWDEGERSVVKALCPDSYPHPPTSLYDVYHSTPTNPTYSQLMEFLRTDNTEDLPYSDNFTCWGYAITMKRNAEKQGIRCAIISMSFKNELTGETTAGHVINMFEVVDPPQEGREFIINAPGGVRLFGGWELGKGDAQIYVDPQYTDIMRDIKVGGRYSWYVKYSELQYGDNYNKGVTHYGGVNDVYNTVVLMAMLRASNAGREYIFTDRPSRYSGNQDAIKEYKEGPNIKASDNIAKIIVIW